MLAIAADDGSVTLTKVDSSQTVRSYNPGITTQFGLAYTSGSGSLIVHLLKCCSVYFSRQQTQPQIRCFTPEAVRCSCITACGTVMVAGGEGGHIMVWHMKSGQLLRVFKAHIREIMCISLSFDGGLVATASRDSTCKVWRLADLLSVRYSTTVQPVKVLSGHTLAVQCCTFAHNSHHVITGSADRTCRLVDIANDAYSQVFTLESAVTYVAHRDQRVAVGTAGGRVHIFSIGIDAHRSAHHAVAIQCSRQDDPVVFLSFMEDSYHILVVLERSPVMMYHTVTGAPLRELISLHPRKVTSAYLLPRQHSFATKPRILAKHPQDLSLQSYATTIPPRITHEMSAGEDDHTSQSISDLEQEVQRLSSLRNQLDSA